MIKLSIIIPSYWDKYNKNTVEDILKNSELGEQLEVVVVQDGFWMPPDWIVDDPRVRYIHLGENGGMKNAINCGMRVARGEFVMRLDEHVAFAKGFDKVLTDECQPNWILTARRFFLDPVQWKTMDIPPVDCEKLVIQKDDDGNDFKWTGQRWKSRAEELKDEPIIESMAMQGSCWAMPKKWWDEVIVELDGPGPHYGDSHEVVFKTWKAGGKLMVTKNTFFSHKHRSFPRTHNGGSPENPWKKEYWTEALDQWKDYYVKEIKPKWKI